LRIDFDVEWTHHGADPPDAEPYEQLLQVLVGEQQYAAALGDAAALEEGGDVGGDLVEGAEADRGSRFQIDDRGLAGIAIPVLREELRDRAVGDAKLMIAEHAHRLPPSSRLQSNVSFRGALLREPGIQGDLPHAPAPWIPGSREGARPGMTGFVTTPAIAAAP